jgi:G:T-mismatch repair DNA endonuclease (very short patch repair protein)
VNHARRDLCGGCSVMGIPTAIAAAALYCWVSTADQTCARQERDLRAFAKKAGYKVVGVWKGNASGAKQEVLALAQARKVDVILVTELTRRGRSARIAARSYRGRDAHYWAPPAQIPAGVIHAPGSHLG